MTDHIPIGEEVSKNCYVLNVGSSLEKIARLITRKIKNLFIISIRQITGRLLIGSKAIKDGLIEPIYEYIDAISEEISGNAIPDATYQRHNYLIHAKDVLVVASADKLYQEVCEKVPAKKRGCVGDEWCGHRAFYSFGGKRKSGSAGNGRNCRDGESLSSVIMGRLRRGQIQS